MRWIVLLFLVVPLAELYLLLVLGRIVGFWPTVGLTAVTAIVGGALARREGLKVLAQWRDALQRAEPPSQGVLDGVLILLGGAFLVTPGVLTDAAGLLLLVPWSRSRISARVRRTLDARLARASLDVVSAAPFERPGSSRPGSDVVETTGIPVDANDD